MNETFPSSSGFSLPADPHVVSKRHLEHPFLRPAERLGQGPGPGGRLRIEIGQDRRPPPADEPAHPFGILGGIGAQVRESVPPDDPLHFVGEAEQLFLVPDRVEQLLQAGDIVGSRRFVAVQTVGDGSVRQDRSRRLEIVERNIGRGENLISAPGYELERTARLPVDVEVVAVAGVPVPVADQHLDRPEGEEAVEVDGLGEGLESGPGRVLQRRDHRVDVRPVRILLVGLLLEGAAPVRSEVADGAFVEIAVRVGETALEKGGLDALDVREQAQVFAVDRYGGEVAARGRQAG